MTEVDRMKQKGMAEGKTLDEADHTEEADRDVDLNSTEEVYTT